MGLDLNACLTTDEVLSYLKVTPRTIYRLIRSGELPALRIGRQWRFHKSILDEWFRQHAATVRVNILVVDDEEVTRHFITSALHGGQRHIQNPKPPVIDRLGLRPFEERGLSPFFV